LEKILPITITDNGWEGELKTKIDASSTGCKDSGAYNFKIQDLLHPVQAV